MLLVSSSGVPASDISVDELDDVGVKGLWNIVFEVMMSGCLSKSDVLVLGPCIIQVSDGVLLVVSNAEL